MFVKGADSTGADFLDLTKTLDISATGASLACNRLFQVGQVLHLTIPTPPSPSDLLPAETPPIHARVRSQRMAGDFRLLGVEFLNKLD